MKISGNYILISGKMCSLSGKRKNIELLLFYHRNTEYILQRQRDKKFNTKDRYKLPTAYNLRSSDSTP
jgi:hypothetical protein